VAADRCTGAAQAMTKSRDDAAKAQEQLEADRKQRERQEQLLREREERETRPPPL
jgi:hypothetical protein